MSEDPMTNSISEAMIEAGDAVLKRRKFSWWESMEQDEGHDLISSIYLAMSRASQPEDTGVGPDDAIVPRAEIAAIHEVQHEGSPLVKPLGGGSVVVWVVQELRETRKRLSITPPLDSEAVERVAFAARAFCAELQEDGEGVPQPQLKRLHDALDAWEMIAPEAAYDDSTEMTALLASLKWVVEDGNEPDRVRQTARAAMSAILSLAKGWQPLDTFAEPTSPGSGDGVLIAERDGTVGEAYFRNFGDDDDGWWWINTTWGDYPEPVRPTPVLWMPLPGADAALTAMKEDDRG